MIELWEADLRALERKTRIRLHNSLLGGKPAHLVGTASAAGVDNLAVFNSACHISSDPALIGMMCRPLTVRRDTYANIRETGVWTLNTIHALFVDRAHRAADKVPSAVSEFLHAGLQPGRMPGFAAPFVAESPLQVGLEYVEEVPIPSSGTVLLVGRVCWVRLREDGLTDDGSVQIDRVEALSSLGLDAYAEVREHARFPYQSTSS